VHRRARRCWNAMPSRRAQREEHRMPSNRHQRRDREVGVGSRYGGIEEREVPRRAAKQQNSVFAPVCVQGRAVCVGATRFTVAQRRTSAVIERLNTAAFVRHARAHTEPVSPARRIPAHAAFTARQKKACVRFAFPRQREQRRCNSAQPARTQVSRHGLPLFCIREWYTCWRRAASKSS